MFTQLLAEHFVHTALFAGAVVSVVAGAIGVFVVTRGASFAVHAISELGFTGAAGALVIGIGMASVTTSTVQAQSLFEQLVMPGPLVAVQTMSAPTKRSLAFLVRTVPLLVEALLPVAAALTSRGVD